MVLSCTQVPDAIVSRCDVGAGLRRRFRSLKIFLNEGMFYRRIRNMEFCRQSRICFVDEHDWGYSSLASVFSVQWSKTEDFTHLRGMQDA